MKKWYSFNENTPYEGEETPFFDIEKKDWKALLENNYKTILEEFEKIVQAKDENIIPYYNKTLASHANNWTIFPLFVWGKKQNDNCLKCPETARIAESIPGMTSCSFSVLKPNTNIKPHYGDSNVMYRCHLTLRCNHQLPDIGMRVKNDIKTWENGHVFAFCDAYEHEVWNNTNEERWVLIIDILREEFTGQKKKICSEVNATLLWQHTFQNFNIISHIPMWGRKLMISVTSLFT